MQVTINLVSYSVDTLFLNVRYADKQGQPVKQRVDEADEKTGHIIRLLHRCYIFREWRE